MTQNNLEEILGNLYINVNFIMQVIIKKKIKKKNGCKTCVYHIYAKYYLKNRMYPQRHKINVSLEISAHLAQNVHRAMIVKENLQQKVESPNQ